MNYSEFTQKLKELELDVPAFCKMTGMAKSSVSNWTNRPIPPWLDSWFFHYGRSRHYQKVEELMPAMTPKESSLQWENAPVFKKVDKKQEVLNAFLKGQGINAEIDKRDFRFKSLMADARVDLGNDVKGIIVIRNDKKDIEAVEKTLKEVASLCSDKEKLMCVYYNNLTMEITKTVIN